VNLNLWSDNINLEICGSLAHWTTSIERVRLLKLMMCSFRRSWGLNFLKLQLLIFHAHTLISVPFNYRLVKFLSNRLLPLPFVLNFIV
jgi:hypothetical protein